MSSVNKVTREFERIRKFSGIIFDCDGVLIDSSQSYDEAILVCARAFYMNLGYDLRKEQVECTVANLRKLGTFNNDWDSVAVLVAFLVSKVKNTDALEEIAKILPLSERLIAFESLATRKEKEARQILDLGELTELASRLPEGTTRTTVCDAVKCDAERLNNIISYPKPVGESLLATFFDEVVYGRKIFREMYGIECSTKLLSDPGLITKEKKLVKDSSLSSFFLVGSGNLGVITGRPKLPTIYTLGDSFKKWFTNEDICLFTGDYLLDLEEVKPSPKPILKVKEKLSSEYPILYVGDSGEDILMVKQANRISQDGKIFFAGIASSASKERFFRSEDGYVDCIVSDVNILAELLERNGK